MTDQETATAAVAPSPAPAGAGSNPPEASTPGPKQVDSKVECSRGLAEWLRQQRLSLAVTSYQTGQLLLFGGLPGGQLSLNQRNFMRAMGLFALPDRIYLASLYFIWRLENMLQPGELANEHFDRCYVARNAQVTGDIDAHEIAVRRSGQIVFVNTRFSCLATPSLTHSFKPLWKPAFISKLAAEDRCHLNGLACEEGEPRYVTAVSRSDIVDGWRARRWEGGVVVDVTDDRVVTEELSMPHSPRVHQGQLYVLDSGRGHLVRVDRQTGRREPVCFCPGFLRGLSFSGNHAFVTVSLPRDGSFRDLELEANLKSRDAEPWCGVLVIDLRAGDIVHWIRLRGHMAELFDVGVLPGVLTPMAISIDGPEILNTHTMEAMGKL